ncbi:MAG TPA: hypothetical protein VM536_16650, partial [Chloroflexia bacterium]|nr:hypothetical protein [Chloroflexia bacterium]
MKKVAWRYWAAALVALLAIAGVGGAANAARPGSITAPPPPAVKAEAPFDCSLIEKLGIDRQLNLRAAGIMQQCGRVPGGQPATGGAGSVTSAFRAQNPAAYGGADVNTITGAETSPNVTQSETFVWGQGNTVIAAYNDSRGRNANPINISGASVSTDGGTTFTRLTTAGGQSPFPGTEGDPVVLYDAAHAIWLTVWLDTACGAQGLGGFKSATPFNAASWTHFCVHNSSQDDRESGWVDNNPASPYYGRVYISYANYNLAGPPISVTYSTDAGVTWSAPTNLPIPAGASFVRDVQATGSPNGDGAVFIAGMDEGGGGLANRRNFMYRSTDGGVTWPAAVLMGAAFPAAGQSTNGYFATMFGTYWRHMGWGQPAVGPQVAGQNVVHYAWAQHGPASDYSDVYYSRSTDNGASWSAGIKLNTDATTLRQWQPSLAANAAGAVFVGWYDQRNGNEPCVAGANAPCYERFGRASLDNGLTWQADQSLSDVISPLPAQPDPGIQASYVGDYDYSSANGNNFYQTWVDGRVLIGGASQQDVFFDKIPLIQGTPTPTASGTPPTATPTRTLTTTPTATATVCAQVTGNNPAPITINDANTASPYPSNITVAGTGTIGTVSVSINGLSHTWPDDVDMLLVGPNGGKVLLMSDAGGSLDLVGVNLTFQDGFPAIPDGTQITSGTYAPADYEVGEIMPAPAPPSPYGTSLTAAFAGSSPAGTWSLYIVDDAGADLGSITGGWSLTIGLSGGCATVTPVPATGTPTNTPTDTAVVPTRTP